MKPKPVDDLPEVIADQEPAAASIGIETAAEVIEPPKRKIAVRFLGGDTHFWQGIPNHDLTADEWDEVSQGDKDQVLALKLYELAEETPKDGE